MQGGWSHAPKINTTTRVIAKVAWFIVYTIVGANIPIFKMSNFLLLFKLINK